MRSTRSSPFPPPDATLSEDAEWLHALETLQRRNTPGQASQSGQTGQAGISINSQPRPSFQSMLSPEHELSQSFDMPHAVDNLKADQYHPLLERADDSDQYELHSVLSIPKSSYLSASYSPKRQQQIIEATKTVYPMQMQDSGKVNISAAIFPERPRPMNVGEGENFSGRKCSCANVGRSLILSWLIFLTIRLYKIEMMNNKSHDDIMDTFNQDSNHDFPAEYDGIDTNVPWLQTSVLSDGSVALDVNVDKIRMKRPKVYKIQGEMEGVNRIWSAPGITIYIGDYIQWSWQGNENIVSCDSDGRIIRNEPYLNSGRLGTLQQDQYTARFNFTGIFYYTSEHSYTMKGVVMVIEIPYMSMSREMVTGPFTPIPSGVQRNANLSSLGQIDGCWRQCYYATAGTTTPTNFLSSCDGEWIFIAAVSPKTQNVVVVGAFGRKEAITANTIYASSITESDITIATKRENNVYWYKVEDSFGPNSFQSLGFTSQPTVTLSWAHNWIDTNHGYECINSLSWGLGRGSALSAASCAVMAFNKLVATNECALLLPISADS